MRQSGILMHITSLPGPYGIGTMGAHARAFVDFLESAGQSKWQILPLTPTGFGDSPYQSCSAFAGNPYLIDLDTLVQEGLLSEDEPAGIVWNTQEDRVDFGILYEKRYEILHLAYTRFQDQEALTAFCQKNSDWLPDFVLYMALKEHNGAKPWYEWEDGLKNRDPDTLYNARKVLRERIEYHCFVQYLFDKQWKALREYAHEKGIQIIGDVPIYVPHDSADVWSAPELFDLDVQGWPNCVAGCPPDAFTQDGQLWGNPLYRWDVHERDGYNWWIRRMAAAQKYYDVIRLDHFRGFESYWAVPYGDKTARGGHWEKGPASAFFKALQKALPDLQLIAEDLGFITDEVKTLRQEAGIPGMKVLQFAFDGEDSDYLPHNCTQNSVCYTGTHDNMTLWQWLENASETTRARAFAYMAIAEEASFADAMIRTAMATVCQLSILQMQDLLNPASAGRMNTPGISTSQNWTWRALQDDILPESAQRLRRMSALYARLGTQKNKKNA